MGIAELFNIIINICINNKVILSILRSQASYERHTVTFKLKQQNDHEISQ